MICDWFEECVKLVMTATDDGYGGHSKTLASGDTFTAAIALRQFNEKSIADHPGSVAVYTVIAPDDIEMHENDLFKRMSDSVTFRVCTEPKKSPWFSDLDCIAFDAEVVK